jgi:putative ABC transport system ATP-binding protein
MLHHLPEPLITVRSLERRFAVGDENVYALRRISFRIDQGEYVSIVGPSGCGKTTLMHVLGCLDTPSAGSYRLAGREVSGLAEAELARVRNERIGFVFQAFCLLPRTSVLDDVMLPLSYRPMSVSARRALALEALERTHMVKRQAHWPNQLSGGERQRVAIARAIVTRPPLLLCDEPTGNLDRRVSEEITGVFESLNRELGITLVIVTHDLELARRARRTLRILDGELVHDGPAGVQ